MREGIGSVFLYNMIIVFIFLIFAFLAAIMSYSKAFKVNSRIVSIIEKFEGPNDYAMTEIERYLHGMGYRGDSNPDCPASRSGLAPKSHDMRYRVCIYGPEDTGNHNYRYEVVTYMNFDFTAFGVVFSIPVYAKTNSMYRFD